MAVGCLDSIWIVLVFFIFGFGWMVVSWDMVEDLIFVSGLSAVLARLVIRILLAGEEAISLPDGAQDITHCAASMLCLRQARDNGTGI
jgi:hypothetical protein